MLDRTAMNRTTDVRMIQRDMERIHHRAERMRNQAIGRATREIGIAARNWVDAIRAPRRRAVRLPDAKRG